MPVYTRQKAKRLRSKVEEYSQSPAKKARNQRTLEDLVALCVQLGDTGDKSAILKSFYERFRGIPDWGTRPCILREREIIHDCTVRLERYLVEFIDHDCMPEDTFCLMRKWYWDFSPLTNEVSLEDKDAPLHLLSSIDAESRALYIETQLVFASLGAMLTSNIRRLDRAEIEQDRHGDPQQSFFYLTTGIRIPWTRFVTRTITEIKRLAHMPGGTNLAFRLALILRTDIILCWEHNEAWHERCPSEGTTYKECTAVLEAFIQEEKKKPNAKHLIDSLLALHYMNEFCEANSCSAITCNRENLKWIYFALQPWARRRIQKDVLLAVGKKLPTDICELVLDWTLALHGIAKSTSEWDRYHYNCQNTWCEDTLERMKDGYEEKNEVDRRTESRGVYSEWLRSMGM